MFHQTIIKWLTNQNCARYLAYGGQNTGLTYGKDPGADTGAKRIGHVVGTDPEGQDERDQKADDHHP